MVRCLSVQESKREGWSAGFAVFDHFQAAIFSTSPGGSTHCLPSLLGVVGDPVVQEEHISDYRNQPLIPLGVGLETVQHGAFASVGVDRMGVTIRVGFDVEA